MRTRDEAHKGCFSLDAPQTQPENRETGAVLGCAGAAHRETGAVLGCARVRLRALESLFDCWGSGGSMSKSPQTVIGIPGRWPNRSDVVTSIASRSGGYLFAGIVMMKIGTKDGFKLEIYEHDPKLRN